MRLLGSCQDVLGGGRQLQRHEEARGTTSHHQRPGLPETALSSTSCGGGGGLEDTAGSGLAFPLPLLLLPLCNETRRHLHLPLIPHPLHTAPACHLIARCSHWVLPFSALTHCYCCCCCCCHCWCLLKNPHCHCYCCSCSLSASPLPAVHPALRLSPLLCHACCGCCYSCHSSGILIHGAANPATEPAGSAIWEQGGRRQAGCWGACWAQLEQRRRRYLRASMPCGGPEGRGPEQGNRRGRGLSRRRVRPVREAAAKGPMGGASKVSPAASDTQSIRLQKRIPRVAGSSRLLSSLH